MNRWYTQYYEINQQQRSSNALKTFGTAPCRNRTSIIKEHIFVIYERHLRFNSFQQRLRVESDANYDQLGTLEYFDHRYVEWRSRKEVLGQPEFHRIVS